MSLNVHDDPMECGLSKATQMVVDFKSAVLAQGYLRTIRSCEGLTAELNGKSMTITTNDGGLLVRYEASIAPLVHSVTFTDDVRYYKEM
ncbi:MAG: hypothetical protein US89_C0011G0023 [Candidatus Peregrinibacteria bacterium GW2011_GWF2_38_29]|nr:MAG: hypothetical protein US89_C0011G0023 [Candidatus Peregrinibacteria bacterium GW2011_GWF2_38_29]HBB02315.1 hypothetical protein [Candidatus Peregrinibacteria bacterium]